MLSLNNPELYYIFGINYEKGFKAAIKVTEK